MCLAESKVHIQIFKRQMTPERGMNRNEEKKISKMMARTLARWLAVYESPCLGFLWLGHLFPLQHAKPLAERRNIPPNPKTRNGEMYPQIQKRGTEEERLKKSQAYLTAFWHDSRLSCRVDQHKCDQKTKSK